MNAIVSYNEWEGNQGKAGPLPPIEPQVVFVCFNVDGARMVSVDVRPDIDHPETSFHSNLRFWERRGSGEPQEEGPLYNVQNDIDRPHR